LICRLALIIGRGLVFISGANYNFHFSFKKRKKTQIKYIKDIKKGTQKNTKTEKMTFIWYNDNVYVILIPCSKVMSKVIPRWA
jgi:hypothetical protein